MAAIGGWSLEEGRKRFPGLARVTWSEEGVWGKWLEEVGEDQEKINSFMFAWVPLAWIERVCSSPAPDYNHSPPPISPTTTPRKPILTFEAASNDKGIIGICIAFVAVTVSVSLLSALLWYLHMKRGSTFSEEEVNSKLRLLHESPLSKILIEKITRPHRPGKNPFPTKVT